MDFKGLELGGVCLSLLKAKLLWGAPVDADRFSLLLKWTKAGGLCEDVSVYHSGGGSGDDVHVFLFFSSKQSTFRCSCGVVVSRGIVTSQAFLPTQLSDVRERETEPCLLRSSLPL